MALTALMSQEKRDDCQGHIPGGPSCTICANKSAWETNLQEMLVENNRVAKN